MACDLGGVVTRVETGSANVHNDFEGSVAEIERCLNALAEQSGMSESDLAGLPAFLGLAGVSSDDISARLRAVLPFRRVKISDDRPAAVRGALGDTDGVVIHCGTGSFFGIQTSGNLRFAGGWGPILGDEASAGWIGKAALNATLRALDGTISDSSLTDHLLARFGGAEGVIGFAACASPPEFGALAPIVTQAGDAGDPTALSIIKDGARYITEIVERLGWSDGMTLCLTGGVAPCYRAHLSQQLRRCLRQPLGEPLDGALSLAREVCDVGT